MKEMTKAQIQERQLAIWNRIDELDEAGKTRELTAEEVKEQRELVDESAKLSTRAKALASGAELAKIQTREDKGKTDEEREARELEEQEQRFREQQAMRLRYQARRINDDILESLNY